MLFNNLTRVAPLLARVRHVDPTVGNMSEYNTLVI